MLARYRRFALILLLVLAVTGIGAYLLNDWLDRDVSGWFQASIALISFPIILFELDQIRQIVNRKPLLEIGLVNIRDLPFSQVRETDKLSSKLEVAQGYAHFYVVLRNRGTAPARYVKVYIEHTNRHQNIHPLPHIEVSEYSANKPSFINEHNFDFVFRAGTDWIINPNDIEPFGCHISTSVNVTETNSAGVTSTHPQYPPFCEIQLECTVWAEGLDMPIKQEMSVQIVKSLKTDLEKPEGQ